MTLRTLIVDDEPLAREWIRRQLEADRDVEVVGEAEDGFTAASAIQEMAPDLVFLDVQMPGTDGFGVLGMLSGRPPAVVFVTAFDRYAVRAFEVNAVDYLMKPFSRARFAEALARAKSRLETGEARRQVPALLAHLRQHGRYLEWVLVKAGPRALFVKVREVDWIESARNNVVLHTGGKEHLFSATMKAMEEALDPALFLRIHRSAIVNLERVRELRPWFRGDYKVVLAGGQELTLSAGYRAALERFRRLT